jgi:hypothetical protein
MVRRTVDVAVCAGQRPGMRTLRCRRLLYGPSAAPLILAGRTLYRPTPPPALTGEVATAPDGGQWVRVVDDKIDGSHVVVPPET